MPAVKSNPKTNIIHFGTNHLKIDYSHEFITEKTIELKRSVNWIKTGIVILIIIPCRDEVTVIESKVNNIERLCKIGKTIKCTGQNLLMHKNILKMMECTSAVLVDS